MQVRSHQYRERRFACTAFLRGKGDEFRFSFHCCCVLIIQSVNCVSMVLFAQMLVCAIGSLRTNVCTLSGTCVGALVRTCISACPIIRFLICIKICLHRQANSRLFICVLRHSTIHICTQTHVHIAVCACLYPQRKPLSCPIIHLLFAMAACGVEVASCGTINCCTDC